MSRDQKTYYFRQMAHRFLETPGILISCRKERGKKRKKEEEAAWPTSPPLYVFLQAAKHVQGTRFSCLFNHHCRRLFLKDQTLRGGPEEKRQRARWHVIYGAGWKGGRREEKQGRRPSVRRCCIERFLHVVTSFSPPLLHIFLLLARSPIMMIPHKSID